MSFSVQFIVDGEWKSAHEIAIADVAKMGRKNLMSWLKWNDPNGVYSDADVIAEGWEPLTDGELHDMMVRQLEGEL